MRTIRIFQFIYIAVMLVFDMVLGSIFQQFGAQRIVFIGNLHFMALILLTQTESREASMFKALLVGFWMDLTHSGTFPIFMITYTLTMIGYRLWDRYLGYSAVEFVIAVIITLFFKEILLYLLIVIINGLNQSLFSFIAYRVFWVVLGNLLFIPVVRKGYTMMHAAILKRAQNMYIR